MFHPTHINCVLLIYIMIKFIVKCEAEESFNIMIISDKENTAAESTVDVALDYLQHTSHFGINFGCIVKVNNQNISDSQLFLDYISERYSEAVSTGCGPQMILDLTLAGEPFSDAAKTFSYSLGIPTVAAAERETIQPWNKMDTRQLMHLIQVTPPSDTIPKIIHSISLSQNMTNAAIMYDKTFRMSTHRKSLLRGLAIRHIFVEVGDMKRLRTQLTEMRYVDISNYFIFGSLVTIKTVLESVENDNYYNKKFAWHAITQDEGSLKCDCKNMTILFVQPVKSNNDNKERTFFNKNFHKSPLEIMHSFYHQLTIKSIISLKSLLTEENTTKKSSYHNNKNYLNGIISINRTFDLCKHFTTTQDDFTYGPIMCQPNNTGFMKFNMVLKIVSSSNSLGDIIGYWNSEDTDLTQIDQYKLHSLMAKPIYKVVIVELPPFIIKNIDENGNKTYSGFCIDLINEVSEIVGFEYELYTAPDNQFGIMDEQGEWNGLVKDVLEKRADIGLSGLSMTSERKNVVEFTLPFYDLVGMSILMEKTRQRDYYFKFFTVMEKEVWFSIAVVYVFTSIILWSFNRFSPTLGIENTIQPLNSDGNRELSLKECLWYCMTSLTPHRDGNAPSTLAGCLIAATWWLFGFIITASYTANLAASLTVSRIDTTINSLEDLSKQYRVQYAPVLGSSGMTYFQRMADIESRFQEMWNNISLSDNLSPREKAALAVWEYPIGDKYNKMWKAMKEAGMPLTLKEAVNRVLASKSSTDGFAYIGDEINIRYQAMLNCDLQSIGEEFFKLPLAIAVQKGSPLKEKLDKALRKLLHKRRFDQLKEKWWEEKTEHKTCADNDELAEGIGIYNIGGVFIVILSGSLLACATLFFGYCFAKSKTHAVTDFQRNYMINLTKQ